MTILFMFFGMTTDYEFNLLSIIYLLFPTIQRVALDLYVIRVEKKEIDHVGHTTLTIVLIILFSLLNMVAHNVSFFKSIIFSSGMFILLFDYSLNILRGKSWNYIDQGLDGISSGADKIYRLLGVWPVLFFKIVIFMATFAIYYTWSYIAQN